MSSAAAFASLRTIHISSVISLSWLVPHMLMLACAVVASECISLRLLSTYFLREVVSLLWLMSTRQSRNTRFLQGIYTPAACIRRNGVLQLLYNERSWIGAITGSEKPFWCYQKWEDALSGKEMDRKYSIHFIRSGKETLWNMQIPDNVKGETAPQRKRPLPTSLNVSFISSKSVLFNVSRAKQPH